MASTKVVLPWSTCATMATFRRSSRVGITDPILLGLGGQTRPSTPRRGSPFPAPPGRLKQIRLSAEANTSQLGSHCPGAIQEVHPASHDADLVAEASAEESRSCLRAQMDGCGP